MRRRRNIPAAVAVACTLGTAAGHASGPTVSPDTTLRVFPEGRWKDFREHRLSAGLTGEQRAEFARLETLGYVAGSREAPAISGVTRHVRDRALAGINFLTSGHAPEALLIDMDGRLLHRWHVEFDLVWPDYPLPPGYVAQKHYFRRAFPQPNGDLLAIFEGLGIVKLDKDSRVIWALPNGAHHDLALLPSGEILVLTREARILPRFSRVRPVLEDFLSLLSPEGEELRRISILEALERSPMCVVLEAAETKTGDLLHTNAVKVLNGGLADRISAFAEGNVLVSFRELSTVVVIDPREEEVVWAHQADYVHQHDPRVLESGHLLLFDNGEKRSRILELDPASGETVWSWAGTPEQPFFSRTCGLAQRLRNGNTLITESDNGRAIEVSAGGEVVWEWISPHRAGKERELIATLFEMRRLPTGFGSSWLTAGGPADTR